MCVCVCVCVCLCVRARVCVRVCVGGICGCFRTPDRVHSRTHTHTPIHTHTHPYTHTPIHTHTQEPVSRLVSAYNHCKDQHQMDPICAWERPKKKNTGAFDDLSTITNSLSAYNHCKDQHQMDPICAWERPKQNNRAICQSKHENSFIHKTIRESIDY